MFFFLQLLEDHNPKLNRRKLRSNAKSKNIMSFDVMKAGADAVLHKVASPQTIVEEVRRLAGG